MQNVQVARQAFIDWFKSVGMLLIIIGHVVGSPYNIFNLVSQPIYTKQLGVCFFIFVMGWSLANEKRGSFKVVFNRSFPLYFYGLLFALLLSAIFIFTINDINKSNYLPFFLGANVFLNYFPANPTTWYIGTYLHILLFWFFVMRGKQVTKTHLTLAIVFEVFTRAFILYLDKDFIAYMLLPNWITVFLLGSYLYKKQDTNWNVKTILIVIVWVLFTAIWASSHNTIISPKSFPFRELIINNASLDAFTPLIRSLIISIIYAVNTYVCFEIFRRLPASKIIEFFARNSLITFIIHMPLIYALDTPIYSLFEQEWLQKMMLILLIFFACAFLSELMNKIINIRMIQEKVWFLVILSYSKLKGTDA